ncbi:MAG: tetratricopeptide repeat protein [Isosphaerales bacterium]
MWQGNYEVAELTGKVGRPEDALSAHRQVLAAREAPAAGSQADPELKADVGRSLTAVAGLLESTGRTKEAEATYRKAETLLIELAPTLADAAAARAVLANCRSRLGWLLHATGRSDEALSVYRLALADQEALAAARGATTESRRGLADTIHRVGTLLRQMGKPSEAEAEHRKAQALYQKLADANPSETAIGEGLAVSHYYIGSLLSVRGDTTGALAAYGKAVAILQELADGDAKLLSARDWLAFVHSVKADELRHMGSSALARDGYDRSIAIKERLVQDHPQHPYWRRQLAGNVRGRGLARLDMGDLAGAAADARRALGLFGGLPAPTGDDWFATSCCHAALAGLAGRDASGVSAGEAFSEADKAMALLQKTVGSGYRNPDAFRTESALDPLRNRPDFQLLMMDLAFPVEPFARGD